MKKTIQILMCLILCLTLTVDNAFSVQRVHAADGGAYEKDDLVLADVLNVTDVVAEYNDAERNLLFEVLDVDGGVMDDLPIRVQMTNPRDNIGYRVFQYDGRVKKTYPITESASPEFSMPMDDLYEGIPVYMTIVDRGNGQNLWTKLLNIRVNKGRAQELVPPNFESEYRTNIEVSMDELLPGMNFAMHPYILPITAKAYTDGRFVIGLGINSSNVSFWKNARNGTLQDTTTVKELSDAFWGNTEKRSAVKGKDMGLVVEFAGSVQGNIYTTDPMKGTLTAYVGSGFNVSGQYMILTWEVTVSVGVSGVFEFSLKFDEATEKYSKFEADRFSLQFKTGLELYGGIGLSSIASIGIYGAGSIAGVNTFYPKGQVDSLILAGECGFKAKVFSRTLFTYAIVSGSHEFVKKTNNRNALLNVSKLDDIDAYLLEKDYASVTGAVHEPETSGKWYTGSGQAYSEMSGQLRGYETDPDFEHLIASDVYPDNGLQVVQTGIATIPSMNVVLLGSDPSRANGNRSRLMNFYYQESSNFLSKPEWMYNEDDGTADYEPCVFRSEISNDTFIVWKNAISPVSENATFSEIAKNTDVWFAEHQIDNAWFQPVRVTNYADTEGDVFAAGARVSEDRYGEPLVTYFTNSTEDPAGLDPNGTHQVFVSRLLNRRTVETAEAFTMEGVSIQYLETAPMNGFQTIAVSCASEGAGGKKAYRVELWEEKDGAWNRIFTRNNAMNARFVKTGGNNYTYLTWYENGAVYSLNERHEVERRTPEDLTVPSSDYRIFGKFGGKSSISFVGTVSKDSSENAFVLISNDGGSTWNKADLTDIVPNAMVSEVGIGHTYDNEPIVFYSVQNYTNNVQIGDAEQLLNAVQKPRFEGLGENGLMIGADDPRFSDGQTDLYVKARRANQGVEIVSAVFDDEESAYKGIVSPVTLEVRNYGLYDIDKLSFYVNGQKTEEIDVGIRAGATSSVHAGIMVPSDAPNEPLDFKIGISSKEEIESTYDLTLGTGNIYAQHTHLLRYGMEGIACSVTNKGFAHKRVYEYWVDEDTAEVIRDYPLAVAPQRTSESMSGTISGVWKQFGHSNIRAFILTEEENRKIQGMRFGSVKEIEDFLGLDSLRSFKLRCLDEIYVQDISEIVKQDEPDNNNGENTVPEKEAWKWVTYGGYILAGALGVALWIVLRQRKREKEGK